MHKTELREILKTYCIDEIQKELEEKYLLEVLWDTIFLRKPTCIGLYAAIEHEVDLTSIFKRCQEFGIITAYPRITGDIIAFHEVDALQMLTSKAFGICEPCAIAPLVIPDLLIVPGLAFTRNGKRLGRGKGHYDRYLSQHPARTVSLAFSWTLLDDLPTESHDVLIDKVIYCLLEK